MSVSLERFCRTLVDHEIEVTFDEFRDALWLVNQGFGQASGQQSVLDDFKSNVPPNKIPQQKPAESKSAKSPVSPAEDERRNEPLPREPNAPADVTDRSNEEASRSIDALVDSSAETARGNLISVPAARWISRGLEIDRELRPLRQTKAHRGCLEIDEVATAEALAATGIPQIANRLTRGRWLDIRLVIEVSPTMRLWQETAKEFSKHLLRGCTPRSLRSFTIQWKPHPDCNRRHIRLHTSGGRPVDVTTVSEGTENVLILLVSDCISFGWMGAEIPKAVAEWSRRHPTCLVQVLPPWMWNYSSLRHVPIKEVDHTTLLGASKGRANGQAVAITTITPEHLGQFVATLTGKGDHSVTGIQSPFPALSLPSGPELSATDSRHPHNMEDKEIDERFDRFCSFASPETQRLAQQLAAADTLVLPVMRLIQRVLVSDTAPAQLAELFLSGILYRCRNEGDDAISDDLVEYEFFRGVRERLVELAGAESTLRTKCLVSEYMGKRLGTSNVIGALQRTAFGSRNDVNAAPWLDDASAILPRSKTGQLLDDWESRELHEVDSIPFEFHESNRSSDLNQGLHHLSELLFANSEANGYRIINCPNAIDVHMGLGEGIAGFGFEPRYGDDREQLLAISLNAGNAGIFSITSTSRMPTSEDLIAQGRPAVPSMAGHCALLDTKGKCSFKLVVDSEHDVFQHPKLIRGGLTKPIFLRTFILTDGESDWIQGPNLEFRLRLIHVSTFARPFAITVGNEHTCAAYLMGAPPEIRLLEFENSKSVPTALSYSSTDMPKNRPAVRIGRDVFRHHSEIPMRNFVRNMGNSRVRLESEYSDGPRSPKVVYGDFLQCYLRKFEVREHAFIRRLVATCPRHFSEQAINSVKTVYEDLGIEASIIDEACAASLHFVWERLSDCSFDLGVYQSRFGQSHNVLQLHIKGASADTALTQVEIRNPVGAKSEIVLRVLSSGGHLRIGEDTFTLAVLKAIKCRIAMKAAEEFRFRSADGSELSFDVRNGLEKLSDNLSDYEAFLASTDQDEAELSALDKLVEQVLPTAWRRFEAGVVGDVFARRDAYNTFHGLWRKAEQLKVELVANETLKLDASDLTDPEFLKSVANLPLPPSAVAEISLSREQDFYARIRPVLQRVVSTCRQVVTPPYGERLKIDSIQMAGSSCSIDLVETMMKEEFAEDFPHIHNMIEINLENAEASIAVGACIAGHLQDPGRQLPIRLVFDAIPEQLGWDIGSYEPPFKPFDPYFTADQQPSRKPEYILDDTGQIRIDLFRRRQADTNPPEHLGHFLLHAFSRGIKGIPRVENGKLLLVLTGPDEVKLRKDDRIFELIPSKNIESYAEDPFSGHH